MLSSHCEKAIEDTRIYEEGLRGEGELAGGTCQAWQLVRESRHIYSPLMQALGGPALAAQHTITPSCPMFASSLPIWPRIKFK